MTDKKYHLHTQLIRQQAERSQFREHSAPMYLTSSFVFENAEQMRAMFNEEEAGNIYSRYSNPNLKELIDKVCLMENLDEGFATTTGMAAIYLSMAALLNQGDHLLCTNAVFGSTHQILTQILPRFGITFSYVPPEAPDMWEAALRPNTKMFLCETPANPSLKIVDLEKAGQFCKQHQLIFNVDNCFATPLLQKPSEYGADLVLHSATKFMDGQGRVLGGLVLGKKELMEKIIFFARHTGPVMSPFNAWILSKSLETLPIRMEKHCQNALFIAKELENHSALSRVLYPELDSFEQKQVATKQMTAGGALVVIELKDGYAGGKNFMDSIKMCSLSSNLGDSRTIVTHPASSTHSKLTPEERLSVGISDGLIRISVGLEHGQDILDDLMQALPKS